MSGPASQQLPEKEAAVFKTIVVSGESTLARHIPRKVYFPSDWLQCGCLSHNLWGWARGGMDLVHPSPSSLCP